MMIKIPLTQGKVALIDDEDEWTTKWNWYAFRSRQTFYAARSASRNERSRGYRHTIFLHRTVLDPPKELLVDHVDQNGLNNQRSNLRLASEDENKRNSGVQQNNSSGITGVHWHAGKWQARISVEKKYISLGHFTDIEDALNTRREAELLYWGEFAPGALQ